MSLEEFIPQESHEGGPQSVEVSEKFKESAKRSASGIKRTQKDEKKAKKHDVLLAGFLVQIIVDKKYDGLLSVLFKTLHVGYPSNIILGIMSLVKTEISERIRIFTGKQVIDFQYNSKYPVVFDDNNTPIEIKNRINYWVEDISDIVGLDYSNIKTKELKVLLITKRELILDFTAQIFSFFLKENQIEITPTKAKSISDFILNEVEKEIKKFAIEEV